MAIETWAAFALAAFVVLVIPGPTIVLVLGRAMTYGKRSVLPLVAGVTLGDFTAMMLSLFGLGAVLAASATLFTIFKWAGALYLIYLGVKTWRADPTPNWHRGKNWPAPTRCSFAAPMWSPRSTPRASPFLSPFCPNLSTGRPPRCPSLP